MSTDSADAFDVRTRERITVFVEDHPDATAINVLGEFAGTLTPDDLPAIRELLGETETTEATASTESAPVDDATEYIPEDTDPDSDDESAPVVDVGGETDDVDSWADVDFSTPESGVWSPERLARKQWMGHCGKRPFAPWGDRDEDLTCTKSYCRNHGKDTPIDVVDECAECQYHRADERTTTAECSHDARWKWGYHGHYLTGDEVAAAEEDPRLDGRAFLQTESDPYAYVDGDNVRDTETDEVHPGFVAVLDRLGMTYGDVSTSGGGVHAPYRGELPEGVKEATWDLDDEPWGEHDELPSVEIYAGKRVCVETGEHIQGTPLDVREWDADALKTLLAENDQLPAPRSSSESVDLDDYTPRATAADEVTSDPRDAYAALDRLDGRAVAEKTIVHSWNDAASTSANTRAFVPTWGRNANGTANIVDENIWQDTGGGGYGGPVVMALIDLGEMDPNNASPRRAKGALWRDGYDHLRTLGFDVPLWIPEAGSERKDGSTYDETPFWAVRKAAVALGVLPEDGFITRENDDGETYEGFPGAQTYNRTLAALDDAGIEHGREKARSGATPTPEELGLHKPPEDDADRERHVLLQGALNAMNAKK